MPEADEIDLDRMTRAELSELGGAPPVVAQVLDEWNHREHGVTSSAHGVGLFLDLLAAEGYRVEPIEVADVDSLPGGTWHWREGRA